jgi:hypothetical protein
MNLSVGWRYFLSVNFKTKVCFLHRSPFGQLRGYNFQIYIIQNSKWQTTFTSFRRILKNFD